MADRWGFQFPKTILPERWVLGGNVAVATGGVTGPLPIWVSSLGCTGVPANPSGLFTGVYDLTLTDSWNGLEFFDAKVVAVATGSIGVSGGDFAGGVANNNKLHVQVIAYDVVVSKQIVFQVTDSTTGLGAAVPVGARLMLFAMLSNNSSL